MDDVTIGKLIEECEEVSEWYVEGRAEVNNITRNFAFGVVSGRHDLDRGQIHQLREAYNAWIGEYETRKVSEQAANYLIQSAIKNVN